MAIQISCRQCGSLDVVVIESENGEGKCATEVALCDCLNCDNQFRLIVEQQG